MTPSNLTQPSCHAKKRDGLDCTKYGVQHREVNGHHLLLCNQHADLLDEYAQRVSDEAAADRLLNGIVAEHHRLERERPNCRCVLPPA